ncbi:molybdopterin-guanine dinucleotide biosynthesis protein B [Gordonibacter faecis]|uniref:Probable molybdenum cofactor guanylyltransferase n=1 Tax=Gordonibacter faecis TaxID=3047475 RepID=A0ABT7DJQ0_9ACTN|nr:molybdopterin-guanine dinucleotide biosynthesis protein B [Gordonibacter sp. KGMB12511]MDJ1649749.1 molybdopterin-guanine dinucleotide biosynthesis protein B [Gordonibacter sp. KGMB12511]
MIMVNIPSPAVSIVGRHNSGKTTLIERLIAELVARGHDVGSVKHHSHVGLEIDYPGKDSFRHRAAGASETVIAAPGQLARIKTLEGEVECSDIVRSMPGHDIVVVEGYRKSGLPTIEIMRAGNEADARVAEVFAEGARRGWPLGTDFTQFTRGTVPPADDDEAREALRRAQEEAIAAENAHFKTQHPDHVDISNKLPTNNTVAIVTDIEEALRAAELYNVPAFDLDDIAGLATLMEERFVRPRVTVVIQAGGESRRMGRSKATVPFAGRPLICRLVERLAPVADDLVITTNEPDNLAFLHTEFPQYRVQLVCDSFDYRGALPGLYTALQAARNPYVAVVACDMVFASASLVVAEALAMNETGADVVVPVNKHGFEPFHAMYRRMACLPAVRRALDRGEKRAQAFFDDVEVLEFPQSAVLEAEPMGGCFINANTPEELHSLEESFLEG